MGSCQQRQILAPSSRSNAKTFSPTRAEGCQKVQSFLKPKTCSEIEPIFGFASFRVIKPRTPNLKPKVASPFDLLNSLPWAPPARESKAPPPACCLVSSPTFFHRLAPFPSHSAQPDPTSCARRVYCEAGFQTKASELCAIPVHEMAPCGRLTCPEILRGYPESSAPLCQKLDGFTSYRTVFTCLRHQNTNNRVHVSIQKPLTDGIGRLVHSTPALLSLLRGSHCKFNRAVLIILAQHIHCQDLAHHSRRQSAQALCLARTAAPPLLTFDGTSHASKLLQNIPLHQTLTYHPGPADAAQQELKQSKTLRNTSSASYTHDGQLEGPQKTGELDWLPADYNTTFAGR